MFSKYFKTIVEYKGIVQIFDCSYKAREFCTNELDCPVTAWDCDEEAFNYYFDNNKKHDFTINPERADPSRNFYPNRWLNGRKEQTICYS